MKKFFFVLLSIALVVSCSAQNKTAVTYDSFAQNDNHQIELRESNTKHIIKYSRKIDSLFVHLEVVPSLREIFDSVSHLKNNEQVFLRISQVDNDLYQIDQMNFLNLDGRNISLHKHSDHLFNIDLSEYKVRMVDCENCTDEINLTIYDKKSEKK